MKYFINSLFLIETCYIRYFNINTYGVLYKQMITITKTKTDILISSFLICLLIIFKTQTETKKFFW